MSELNVYAHLHEYLHLAGLYKFYIYFNDFKGFCTGKTEL